MYLVRNIMQAKPGQVRPLVEKFKELGKFLKKSGYSSGMRITTDVAGERYWTVVSEQEVENLEQFGEIMQKAMAEPKFQKIMKDYHDHVVEGRREIFKIEG